MATSQLTAADAFQSDMLQASAAVILLAALVFIVFPVLKLPCFFEAATGAPCPLCGGTTAIMLMCAGDPLAALYSNPAVTLLSGLFILAVVAEIITRHLKLADFRQGYLSVRAHIPVAVALVSLASWLLVILRHVTS